MVDEKKTKKPYAFICFESEEEANKLFTMLTETDKDSAFFYSNRKRAKELGRA